jgi:hypothetical protein
MKLVYEFDEKEILETVKEGGGYNLQSSIVDEIKRQAKEQFVQELYSKIVDNSGYTQDKFVQKEVEKEIHDKIQGIVENQIEQNFSDKNLSSKIERMIDDKLDEWVSTKIYSKLEDIKADIFFGSTNERNEQEELHQEELEEASRRDE